MGKRLLIRSANFEENGFNDKWTWYLKLSSSLLGADHVPTSGTTMFFMAVSEITRIGLNGKTINCAKMYCPNTGTIELGFCNPNDNTEIDVHTYNVVTGINIIKLQSSSVASTSCVPFVRGTNFTWWSQKTDVGYGWNFNTSANTNRIPIDWGFTTE